MPFFVLKKLSKANKGVVDLTQFLQNKKKMAPLHDPYFERNRRTEGRSPSSAPSRPSTNIL